MKKIYAIDNGLINAVSAAFTENTGRKLENLVYLYLRQRHSELYYYQENGECDFVTFEKGKATQAIQVCSKIDDHNFSREKDGLLAAMKAFDLKEGIIVSLNQEDQFEIEGMLIKVVPAHKYLSV